MSEDKANETQEEVTAEQEPVAESNTADSNLIPERPEYVPEKFWNTTDGLVKQEEVFKSYAQLEKFVGGKKEELTDEILKELTEEAAAETPEEYKLPPMPENITEEMVNENPMTSWWSEHCKNNNYNQEDFETGINQYVDMMVAQQPNIEQEMKNLGENAEARLDAVDSWASTFFPPEEYESISTSLGTSAQGIEALERMMESTKISKVNSEQYAQPERQLTIDDVRQMMKDKRYYDPKDRDPSYVKKVDDAFARLYRG